MRKRRLLFISATFLAVLVFAAGLFILRIGYWLSRNDTLQQADAIVVLSGSLAERPLYGADLFHQKYADHIYLSRAVENRPFLDRLGIVLPSQLAISLMVFSRRGVPEQRITTAHAASASTVEEAAVLAKQLPANWRRLIIVTSPYHVFRTRLIFNHRFPHRDVMVVGSSYSSFRKNWWTDQSSAMMVIYEILKTGFFLTGGRYLHNEAVEP
jgi:uncharacterized SAM-binding protein YcdF (DUF218 family)